MFNPIVFRPKILSCSCIEKMIIKGSNRHGLVGRKEFSPRRRKNQSQEQQSPEYSKRMSKVAYNPVMVLCFDFLGFHEHLLQLLTGL